jgi:3-deoxy-D-manno-octulosonic-acid transferase
MKSIFFFIYEFLLMPFVVVAIPLAALFHPKVKEGLRLRKLDKKSNKWLGHCVWIHVSSGEWEYARPLARLLKSRGDRILVTHFSPSVRRALENSKEVDAVYALPMDTRFLVKDFFERFKPRVLMLARTDLWPVLLNETKKRKIPIVLFSATLSNEVLEGRSKLATILQKIKFSFVDRLYCVSKEDQSNLDLLLGAGRSKAIGDTRFDQAIFRLQNAKTLKNFTDPKFKYFVAGSTWKPDEEVLVPAIDQLGDTPLRFVIVPHEPTPAHLQYLKNLLSDHGLQMRLYSDIKDSSWAERGEVCVVDQVGVLAELYLQADYAFVGNSFKTNSIHSVMEPLAAGCLTFVGPFHKNNREAIEFSSISLTSGFHPVEVVENSDDFAEKLLTVLNAHRPFAEEIKKQVQAKAGASQRLMDEITPLLL